MNSWKFKLGYYGVLGLPALIILLVVLAGCETMPPFECEVSDPDTCAILARLHQIEWNTKQAAEAAAYGAASSSGHQHYPVATPPPPMPPVWEWTP